jgi:ribosome-associated protein
MSESEYAIRPNKSQIKREIKVLNQLGQELIAMPDSMLKRIPLSDDMRRAIADGKRFQRGALQRQLRRIASMMQQEDIEAIRLEIDRQKQPSRQQTAELHQLEQWRDRLIGGDERVMTELIERFANIDRQHLRQLVRNAASEQQRQKPPKSARLLFQYLSQLWRQKSFESESPENVDDTLQSDVEQGD